jgi:hypothetical protein
MVVLVMQEMCHTMLLKNLAVTAADVLNMTVKARNNHSSRTNLHLRHLLKDPLRSKSL